MKFTDNRRLNEKFGQDVNSKRILSMVASSYRAQTLEPSIVDKMVQYCISQKNIVAGFPVTQLASYISAFGYTPLKCDEFISIASQVILR